MLLEVQVSELHLRKRLTFTNNHTHIHYLKHKYANIHATYINIHIGSDTKLNTYFYVLYIYIYFFIYIYMCVYKCIYRERERAREIEISTYLQKV